VEVVTPLFLAGADQRGAELRTPSFKSMLRFWWRALYGSNDIKKMKKDEAKIFGDADYKSELKISLHNTQNCNSVMENPPAGKKITVKTKKETFQISIIEYLAYGLYEYKRGQGNIFNRPHYKPESKFILKMEYNLDHEEEIINSLELLYFFGGIGAKSRNGFGNLNIPSFFDKIPEKKFHEIKIPPQRKNFTSFSPESKLFIFKEQKNWQLALFDIGLAYRQAKNKLEDKHSFNRRPLVAKPIIVKGEIEIKDRHAKPYFLHVHKMPNGKFRGQILFMPYKYYNNNQLENYNRACADMNKIIRKADNFVEEISASREAI
jgi:CRISPR-associated protein Cmr1